MNDLNKTQQSKPTVHFDPTDYTHYLEGMDVTDEQATEILRTLWDIMVQFVDLGFQMDFQSGKAFMPSASIMDSNNAKPHDTKGQTP